MTGEAEPVQGPRWLAYTRLDRISPALRNPKRHDLAHIAASIARHGFADVVIVDERTGRMAAGHGRIESLVHLRQHTSVMPEGLLLDEDGEWLVPVLRGWSSANDAEAEAYLVRHNKTTIDGDWDARMLTELLDDLNTADAELFDELGFSSEELDALLARCEPAGLGQDDDERPAVKAAGGMPVTCPECGARFVPDDKSEI